MEAPQGKEYGGPSGIGRDSVWLTAEDLVEGRDVEVKIEAVMLYPEVSFMGGRKRLNLIGLKFVGKERILGLNATNRKSLGKQFGNIAKAWKGQSITLYVTETQMAGETVKCVRIRNKGSRSATAAEQFLHEDPVRGQGKKAEPAPAIDLSDADEGGQIASGSVAYGQSSEQSGSELFGNGAAEGAGEAEASGAGLASSSAPLVASPPAPVFPDPLLPKDAWLASRKAIEMERISHTGGTLGQQMATLTDRMVELSAEYDREREYRAQIEVQL